MDNSVTEETRGYGLTMRVLHWSMAFIMITMIAAGIYMVNGPWGGEFPASRGWLYDYHRGMGFVLMILVIIRLMAYRFTTPPSPLPVTVSPGQQMVSKTVHFVLYASLITHPIFGWVATNIWGVRDIPVFGLFTLPPLAEKNRELGNVLLEWHGYMGFAIAALIVLHVAAAIYHHMVLKDGVLMRMVRS